MKHLALAVTAGALGPLLRDVLPLRRAAVRAFRDRLVIEAWLPGNPATESACAAVEGVMAQRKWERTQLCEYIRRDSDTTRRIDIRSFVS